MIDKEQAVRVLKAWHQVEFFQIYSIPEPDKEKGELDPVNLFYHELMNFGDQVLPWLNQKAFERCGLDSAKKTQYTLYLGLFDKAVVSKIADECQLDAESHLSPEEIEQRLDQEGKTCFAKLNLDAQGVPDFESFSISTLPWALGYLRRGAVKEMTLARFDQRCELLEEAIDRIKKSDDQMTLSANFLLTLIEQLYKWAEISTEQLKCHADDKVILCQIGFKQSIPDEKVLAKKGKKDSPEQEQKDNTNTEDHDESEETEPTPDESTMPILNSFYIRDLEKAIISIQTGTSGPGLLNYLGCPDQRECDLYTDEALPLIRHILQPANTPAGRWPGNPQHDMSLMQQFAINAAVQSLGNGGVISVNGPPGTGKTTLLKDIVAHNVVERARVLAGFDDASEGITREGFLVQALTGYEMTVASSNNAAVENISRELPLRKDIWEGYVEDCHYFDSVANLMAAKRTKSKKYKPLDDISKASWGMISAVMGAKSKRTDFKDRLFFHKYYLCKDSEIPSEREPEQDLLNFWQYVKVAPKVSFTQAKQAFRLALDQFDLLNQKLCEFEKLLTSGREQVLIRQIGEQKHQIKQLKLDLEKEEERQKKVQIQQQLAQSETKQRHYQIHLFQTNLPNPLVCFFFPSKRRKHEIKLLEMKHAYEKCRHEQLQYEHSLYSIRRQLKRLCLQRTEAETKLRNLYEKWEHFRAQIAQYKKEFKAYALPELNVSITDPNLQQHAYWQQEAMNDLRSKVFIKAMQLHESWLGEVRKIDAFYDRITQLSDCIIGKTQDESAIELWRIVFMFVPVISTTFASLGRMFAPIPENTFGWLLIDEAGQAIPQAAVGGLLRFRKTIVVGDPWQIEPVFTSPPALVNYLMASNLGEKQEQWTPLKQSVQTLSDRVNRYGCQLNGNWIGIPLWVHRRCINPMFDIANEIAYQGRMIHGNYSDNQQVPIQNHPQLYENRWIETHDSCSHKQFTQALGEQTITLLIKLIESQGNLEDIYIISPFKAVKKQLKYAIQNSEEFSALVKRKRLKTSDFLKQHIGTVHTFQGKENDTVIFVLGCDIDHQGGATWAASKPNLLNVAVTRAKKNLFIIGNSHVWAKQSFFDVSYRELAKCQTVTEQVCSA